MPIIVPYRSIRKPSVQGLFYNYTMSSPSIKGDGVIHCQTKKEAEQLLEKLKGCMLTVYRPTGR